jgi:hypothetical protein
VAPIDDNDKTNKKESTDKPQSPKPTRGSRISKKATIDALPFAENDKKKEKKKKKDT